ncbi:MAG: response regulator [Candidatus Eisenbacteria bacterium]
MRKTVLVVDDQKEARSLVCHALRSRYDIREAGDFREAAEAAAAGPVDLVLLDLHLPPEPDSPSEGVRIHRLLRERFPAVPVVVLTADESPEVRRDLEGRGVEGYLTKPFDPARLLEVVDALAAGRGEIGRGAERAGRKEGEVR